MTQLFWNKEIRNTTQLPWPDVPSIEVPTNQRGEQSLGPPVDTLGNYQNKKKKKMTVYKKL